MKRSLLACGLLMFATVCHFGQKIEKPTLTAKPLTEHQRSLVEEGIGLHKQKKFDAAILKCELVLGENPDATVAIYEKAISLYTKGEKEKAIETAVPARYKLIVTVPTKTPPYASNRTSRSLSAFPLSFLS